MPTLFVCPTAPGAGVPVWVLQTPTDVVHQAPTLDRATLPVLRPLGVILFLLKTGKYCSQAILRVETSVLSLVVISLCH